MFQGELMTLPYRQSQCRWGDYNLYGDVYYHLEQPQCTHRDTSVLHNGNATIRIDAATPVNGAREVDNYAIYVNPRDRVIFRSWIKTNFDVGHGGIIGFDAWGSLGDPICEVHPSNENVWIPDPLGYDPNAIYVPYASDWTLLTCDVIIPNTYYTTNRWGDACSPQQVFELRPWICMSWNPPSENQASGWFADAEFLVNPSTAPSALKVNSVPSGIPITIDGAPYTTPVIL